MGGVCAALFLLGSVDVVVVVVVGRLIGGGSFDWCVA